MAKHAKVKRSGCEFCHHTRYARQSKNLCVSCFNAVLTHYRLQGAAQVPTVEVNDKVPYRVVMANSKRTDEVPDDTDPKYLETFLRGLKQEPLTQLYSKALDNLHFEYCRHIKTHFERSRHEQSRAPGKRASGKRASSRRSIRTEEDRGTNPHGRRSRGGVRG